MESLVTNSYPKFKHFFEGWKDNLLHIYKKCLTFIVQKIILKLLFYFQIIQILILN
jgi:hypothetical protein